MARPYSPPPRRYQVSHTRPIEGVLFWVQPLPLEERLLERNEQRARIEPLMRQSILARERFLRGYEHPMLGDPAQELQPVAQADQALLSALAEDITRQRTHDERIHELLSSINERLAYLEQLEISRTLPLPSDDMFNPEEFMWRSKDQLPPVAPDVSGLRPTPDRHCSDSLRAHIEFLPFADLDYAVRYNLEHLLRLHYTGDSAMADFTLRKAMYAAFVACTYSAWYFAIREQRNMDEPHYRHFWRNFVALLPEPENRRAARVFYDASRLERLAMDNRLLCRAIFAAFQCDVPLDDVKEFAAQHIRSYKCVLVKDYIPSVRSIYEYYRNFQLWIRYAMKHDLYHCSIFTGGIDEDELSRIMFSNIEPSTSPLAQRIRQAVTDDPALLTPRFNWLDKLLDVFKDVLQRNPAMRVHYDPDLPGALRPFVSAVSYDPVFPSPLRPGQPTSGDLFCLACFTHYVETCGRRATRANVMEVATQHDTEYCPRVLGVWNPANPVCNPGPAVSTHDALTNCARFHSIRDI